MIKSFYLVFLEARSKIFIRNAAGQNKLLIIGFLLYNKKIR